MLVHSTGSVFADVERLGARDREGEVRVAKAHVMARLFGTEARQRLGRYELEVCIGEGAHGRVYRAFDPRLRRHVAVKVLRAEAGLVPSQLRRARAEAHGLARLQHPGVVAVYDVGTGEMPPGRPVLYLVMELVDGLDLGRWLAARKRPWQDVLRVGLSAGRGLSAAHRAGLVHRDVKPGNVLVEPGGTAKVADFGLVARAGSPSTTARTQGSLEIDARVTATGHVLGTPLYMPPEQHDGGTVDARADQYAFCVALWEALWGAPPFQGTSIAAVHVAKLSGPPDPPVGTDVPPALARVLARGLHVEAASRHRDMDALLEALEVSSPRARGRRSVVLGAAIVGALAVGSGSWATAPAPCDPEASTLRAESGGAIEAAFAATGRTDAVERAGAALHALEGWHARWGDATCAAGGEAEVAACLSLAWDERTALVAVLADADARVVGRAVAAIASLPAPEDCAAGRPSAASGSPRAAQDLARARALQAAGREREAWGLARGVLEGLHRDDPSWLEAAFRVGRLELLTGEGGAARTLEDVHHQAIAREDARMAAASGAQLLQLHARTDDAAAAERWDRHTAAALARAGDPDDVRLVWLHGRGMLAQRVGRPADAIAAYGEAALLADRIGAADQAATSLGMRGLARRDLGELDGAEADLRRALELREALLGTDDPRLLGALQNLASVLVASGDHAAAREVIARARALVSRHRGPDDEAMIDLVELLGMSAQAEGDLDRAASLLGEVVAARERDAEARPRQLAHARFNLGNVAALRGEIEAAARHHAEALRWMEDAVGPEHPEVAFVLSALADVERERGDLPAAFAHLQRAEAILSGARVPDTRRAELWSILANTLVADGRAEEARAPAERAIAAFRAAGPAHESQAEALEALLEEHAPR